MKSIRINRLCLENFKCHRLLELDLRGRSASVYGDNAAGKTSIYDALTWLLFGKDSKGNGEKNIDLKPLGPDGQVADHQAITAVEAELDVDGQITTLRRTRLALHTSGGRCGRCGAPSAVAAKKLLTATRPNILWTGCPRKSMDMMPKSGKSSRRTCSGC